MKRFFLSLFLAELLFPCNDGNNFTDANVIEEEQPIQYVLSDIDRLLMDYANMHYSILDMSLTLLN